MKRLVCLDNVIANLPNYRQYVIFRFPSLKMLDYQKVSEKERAEATALFQNQSNLEKVLNQEKAITQHSNEDHAQKE